MKNNQLRWSYLFLLSLIWGSSFILIKKALDGLTPVQVGALRILITAFVLIIVGFKGLVHIKKKQWVYISITAFAGTFFPAFLFAYAIDRIDSSVASILNSLTPLTTLVVGTLLFGFRFKKHQLLGILIGLIGTVVLILHGAAIHSHQNYWFALFPVMASIGYAFNVNILKKYLSDLNALTITVGNFIILIIPTSVVLWYSDFFQSLIYVEDTSTALLYITILAVIGTAFAKTLFNRLVQISSPVFSSSVTYLIPLVAVFWGVIDNERLSLLQIIASLFILLGVYQINRK